jgi:hypothetical protein
MLSGRADQADRKTESLRIDPVTRCSLCHYNKLLPGFFNEIDPEQTS